MNTLIADFSANAALLLVMAVIYDALGFRKSRKRSLPKEFVSGLFLSCVTVAVMATSVKLASGLVFDTRSIVLCLGALFFGTIPAVVAVLISGVYRIAMGGPGEAMGVAVIVLSAAIGLAWRYGRRRRLEALTLGELYLFGVVVHLGMLACTALLPGGVRLTTLKEIALPVMLIYPLTTALGGWVLKNDHVRRLGEEAIKKLALHVRRTPLAVIEWDTAFRVTSWNPGAERVFGYSAEEATGRRAHELIVPESLREHLDGVWQALLEKKGGERSTNQNLTKDGRIIMCEWYNTPLVDEDGTVRGVASMAMDVTERVSAEARVRQLNRLYRTLSEVNQVIVRAADREELLEKTCTILVETGDFRMAWAGFSREDGRVLPAASAGFEKDYLENIIVRCDDAPEGKCPTGKAIRENRAVVFNDCLNEPDFAPWRDAAMARGYRSSAAFPIRVAGKVVGALNLYAEQPGAFGEEEISLLDELGGDVGFALGAIKASGKLKKLNEELERRVKERTTELNQRVEEVEKLNRAMSNLLEDVQSQRKRTEDAAAGLRAANDELKAFAYSVSHDLRAPLRAIDGFTRIIEEDYGPKLGEEGLNLTKRVRSAVSRMGLLIEDLLRLSRIGRKPIEIEKVNLGLIARDVCAGLQAVNGEREVRVEIADNLETTADRHLLRIILENLLGNAWKFTAKTGEPLVQIGSELSDSGDKVFYVRDNGAGFDPAYADKLFAPFQRLHRQDEFPGTGIGLAIVKRIVSRHGGRVWAEGSPGRGTVVRFTLPGENGSGSNDDIIKE